MAKRDLKREFRALYHASARQVAEVEVPELRYLMIDGEGDPNNHAGLPARGGGALLGLLHGEICEQERPARWKTIIRQPMEPVA